MPFFRTSGPAGPWERAASPSIIVDSEAHPPGARHSAPPRHPAGPAIVRSPNLNLRVKVPSKVQFSGSARLIFLLLYHPQGPRTCAGLREVGWHLGAYGRCRRRGLSDDPLKLNTGSRPDSDSHTPAGRWHKQHKTVVLRKGEGGFFWDPGGSVLLFVT
jgi:hypothetical protein